MKLMTCAAAVALCAGALAAQNTDKMDRTFMMTLAQAGTMEIQAGQIAVNRGDASERAFGREMVSDHQALADRLNRLARRLHVDLPSSPKPKDEAGVQRMASLSHRRFVLAYKKFALKSHRQAVGLMNMEIAHGHSRDVKRFAESALRTIDMHLAMAKRLKA